MTLIEKWQGRKLYFKHLKTFGCVAWKDMSDNYINKLDAKSDACIMMGYFDESKAY